MRNMKNMKNKKMRAKLFGNSEIDLENIDAKQ